MKAVKWTQVYFLADSSISEGKIDIKPLDFLGYLVVFSHFLQMILCINYIFLFYLFLVTWHLQLC